jgi:hypothetical protein
LVGAIAISVGMCRLVFSFSPATALFFQPVTGGALAWGRSL